MGFGVYLRSDSPEAETERRIHVQVIYLGHVPTKTVEEAGRDRGKSKQEMVSQPDPAGHVGGCCISVRPAHKETGLSCTCIECSGAEGHEGR